MHDSVNFLHSQICKKARSTPSFSSIYLISANTYSKPTLPIYNVIFPFTSPHKQPSQKHLFCYIYMYCTFTDSKFFCSLTYCRIMFYNVICNLDCTFFDIFFHKNSPAIIAFYNVCRGILIYDM